MSSDSQPVSLRAIVVKDGNTCWDTVQIPAERVGPVAAQAILVPLQANIQGRFHGVAGGKMAICNVLSGCLTVETGNGEMQKFSTGDSWVCFDLNDPNGDMAKIGHRNTASETTNLLVTVISEGVLAPAG